MFTGGEETTCEGSWKLKLKADGGDEEVVDVVDLAVAVRDRGRGIVAHPAGPGLVLAPA